MSDIFEDDDPAPSGNSPEFTVSELSSAVRRLIEGEFALVRVRGEVSRVSRPASGHLYFDLKDDRSVIAAVTWKGQAVRLAVRPEEGMEVVATGRLTTFPGQSKYQLIVEALEPAGAGALMMMLERRKAALAAEGLFDAARKRRVPYLPEVIGVVTSPSGAVIRDILHRLRDRFPRRVVIWPVAVQGEKCAPEVAAAIRGFNALAPDGAIPRPDLIIVARGGGSIEDLWGFNDEAVVRAAAASDIPLISAVGHETDTTLIDHAADVRAPTPTAAAELAVPVRADLLVWSAEQGARLSRSMRQRADMRRQRLADLSRAIGRPETVTDPARQRLDLWSERLGPALAAATTRKRAWLSASILRPSVLSFRVTQKRGALDSAGNRLTATRGGDMARRRERLAGLGDRLGPALLRLRRDGEDRVVRQRSELRVLVERMTRAMPMRLAALGDRLAQIDRTRQTLGYVETLERGFAVVRSGAELVTLRARAQRAATLEIEFSDGRLDVFAARGTGPQKKTSGGPEQGDLF